MSESAKHKFLAVAVALGANKHDAESLINKRLKLWEDAGLVLKPDTEASLTQMLDALVQMMTDEVSVPAAGAELLKPLQNIGGPPTSIPTPPTIPPHTTNPTGPTVPTRPITTPRPPIFFGSSGPTGPADNNSKSF